MSMTRRTFVTAVAGLVAAPALTACQQQASVAGWVAAQDDSLAVLTWKVAGGGTVAMPGEGWAARDGFIQLQLAGGSIPGEKVAQVQQSGDTLTVTLESKDGPETMDLLLTEWRLTPSEGGVDGVSRVMVDHGGGDVRELDKVEE